MKVRSTLTGDHLEHKAAECAYDSRPQNSPALNRGNLLDSPLPLTLAVSCLHFGCMDLAKEETLAPKICYSTFTSSLLQDPMVEIL